MQGWFLQEHWNIHFRFFHFICITIKTVKTVTLWRWLSSGLLHHVVWQKFTNVSEVLAASIIRAMSGIVLMMEAASTSEMSTNFNQTTWHNNPEDSHLHTCHCETLKSHSIMLWTGTETSTNFLSDILWMRWWAFFVLVKCNTQTKWIQEKYS
jgi:hypothetical protein